MPVRRPVVVEHAFRRMQNFVLLDADRFHLGYHVVEVAIRWLIGTTILGRIDDVEVDLQFLVATENFRCRRSTR